ncbi:MAG: hypothetical protein JSU94_00845 [Phycisphaerales bacterium]|nr:MAG: hypothetical protein JSU94_00845 [Phycisphaerales bacterium]
MIGRCRILLAALMLVAAGAPAPGEMVAVDADAYPAGTDMSDLFPHVTLHALGSAAGLDGRVYARQASDPALASTGSNVFGHTVEGTDAHGRPRNETWILPHVMLGVQFHEPADYVAIDVISDDDLDLAALDVYDSAGNLLASPTTPGLPYGEVGRFEVSWSSFEISYMVLAGIGGSAVHIDNLEANVIPEPATCLLLALAAMPLLRKHGPRNVR